MPPEHERWDLGADRATAPVRGAAGAARPAKLTARAASELPVSKMPPAEIGTTLAAIRAASDRDDVVGLACEAALTVSRAAVFLALRKGVLKGWDGAGGGISRDAVRNLWIPTSSASTFKTVIETSEPYVGPYGTAVADGLFRAAVASRGGIVAIHPVLVGGKIVGVLAVDDLSTLGSVPKHRIEILAHAVAEAFKRLLASKKMS